MIILNKHIKVFRYLRRKHRARISVLDKKYGHDMIRELIGARYLVCVDDNRPEDAFFMKTGEYPPSSLIENAPAGIAEAEARDWFDLEFFVRGFALPVAVSIATTLITLFLKGVL